MHRTYLAILLAPALLVLLTGIAFAEDDSDEDMLDLDSLGSYDSDDSAAKADAGFGGVGAVFSGTIINKAAQDLRKDNDQEFLFSDLTIATAKVGVTLSPKVALTLEGLFEYEVETNGDETQADYTFDLWQGNVKWSPGPVDITIGQQHVTWGLVDAINPTDILNPRDYSRLLDFELGYSKLPAPMARVKYYMPKNLSLDAVVLPFFVPAKIPIAGEDLSLFGHDFPQEFIKEELQSNPEWYRNERALDFWYPKWEEDFEKLMSNQDWYDFNTRYLENDFTNAEAAVRFAGRARNLDFSASYMYLWDDIPTLHLNPGFFDELAKFGRQLEGYVAIPNPAQINYRTLIEPFNITYHRTHNIGADIGTTVEGFGLRAEAVLVTPRYTYTEDLRTRTKSFVNWALNIDYMFAGDFVVSGIFYCSSMLDYTPEMLMPPSYAIFMIVMRKPWLDDKLTTDLAASYDFSYLEREDWETFDIFNEAGMLTPQITYAIIDPFKISFGANVLWGQRYRTFGIIRDNARGYVTLRYDF